MVETHILDWVHGGKISWGIYQGENGMFARNNKTGKQEPFLIEFLYDTHSGKMYLTAEWLSARGTKQNNQKGAIHLFPVTDGIFEGDCFTIERNPDIPSVYDWLSPTIVRKINFKTTPHWLNTEFLRKKRENTN